MKKKLDFFHDYPNDLKKQQPLLGQFEPNNLQSRPIQAVNDINRAGFCVHEVDGVPCRIKPERSIKTSVVGIIRNGTVAA